jgi:hypothetical protein
MKLPIKFEPNMNMLLNTDGTYITDEKEISFVVSAVNSHQRLVEALEKVRDKHGLRCSCCCEMTDIARAVLAEIEGESK